MKPSVYCNIGVTACCLGLLGLLVGCFGMSVSFESTNPDTSSRSPTEGSQVENTLSTPISSSLSTPRTATATQVEANTHTVLAYRNNSADKAKGQGTLRISNQTSQPVRLALLARESGVKGSASKKTNYDIPAHWDFAPQEGSEKGLILSLPETSLKLEKGDILVAFAQDGSRRYWGPYVVGETPLPKWNTQNKEWQLVLSP